MDSIKPQPVFVIDTREQTPWEFSSKIETIRLSLPAGDYSLWGYESQIVIERKTLDDYVHTIIHDRERWLRELDKLTSFECKCVIVEADLFDIRRKRYQSRTHPNSILGASNAQFVDRGIPVFYASDRQTAEWMAAGILLRFWRNKNESRAQPN